MNNNIILTILIIISYLPDILFWSSIIYYRNINNTDVKILRQKYFYNISGWEILHFISYLLKGFIFGEIYFIHFICIGFIFEFLELFIQKNSKYLKIKFVDSQIIKDTIVNTIGYFIGMIIFSLIFKKKHLIHNLY